MKTVSFQNPGVMDERAYTLFGASAKEGDNPIGFFGTGLKYAISIWLRLGCEVEIWRGLERNVFALKTVSMRGSNFKVVTVQRTLAGYPQSSDDLTVELGFTSDLGKTWEPWQALRELWCNTLDEKGEMQPIMLEPRDGMTTIHVTGQPALDAYASRDSIMLVGRERWLSEGVSIHERRGSYVFYRGIRVHKLAKPSILTYNIVGKGMELTEDRTLKYGFYADAAIAEAIANSDDEELVRSFLEAPEGSYEQELNMASQEPGATFMRVLTDTIKFRMLRNMTVLTLFKRKRGDDLLPEECEPSATEQQMIERAKSFCRELGLDVARYPIRVTVDMDTNCLGMAHRNARAVYLNRRVFMQGQKMVCGTLMEEIIHLEHNLEDCSRPMQNYLVDLVATAYENKSGVPL